MAFDLDTVPMRATFFSDHFERPLEPSEFMISNMLRTQQGFQDKTTFYVDGTTGQRMVMFLSVKPLYDHDTGDFIGGFARCTKTQTYESYLASKEDWLRARKLIFNKVPHLISTSDANGVMDWHSETYYQYTGRTPEESFGENYVAPIHPDDRAQLVEKFGISLSTGKPVEMEMRIRRRDGLYRWFLGRNTAFKDEQGNTLRWIGSATDIHDLVVQRQQAELQREQMLAIIGRTDFLLFEVDDHGVFTKIEGNMKLSNLQAGLNDLTSLVGTSAFDFADSPGYSTLPWFKKAIKEILSGSKMSDEVTDTLDECVYKTQFHDNSIQETHDTEDRPLRRGVLGLMIDVTATVRAARMEEEAALLAIQKQAAIESDRLKSIFLANMSHEIRTPIAGIIGMADLLGDSSMTAEQIEYIENIRVSGTVLLSIVNDILDFSKIESGRMDIEEVSFNLHSFVNEVSKMAANDARRKHLAFKLDTNFESNTTVLGDPNRIRQILTNFFNNASKFTRDGQISFTATLEREEDDGSGHFSFVVADTGIGIEQKMMERLFQPYKQGDSSTARLYGGSGLGLVICRNLAALMGGEVTLSSEPNMGTTATFCVPLRIAPAEVLSSGRTSPFTGDAESPPFGGLEAVFPRTARSSIGVLLVEDNAINQVIALKAMKSLGFDQVEAVGNGEEALEYIHNSMTNGDEHRRPDVILMDVQMPRMDGYEATRRLRNDSPFMQDERLQKCPIIAMTASAIRGDREKCVSAGMDDYMSKPVQKRELEAMLCKWAARVVRPGAGEEARGES